MKIQLSTLNLKLDELKPLINSIEKLNKNLVSVDYKLMKLIKELKVGSIRK